MSLDKGLPGLPDCEGHRQTDNKRQSTQRRSCPFLETLTQGPPFQWGFCASKVGGVSGSWKLGPLYTTTSWVPQWPLFSLQGTQD